MSKPNNTPAPATVNLAGKTAAEMRELISANAITPATVIAFLQGKEKLRAPSAALLAELTAAPAPAPVKAESKPVVKAEAPAPALDSGILARLAALELAVAALVEAVVKAEAPAPVVFAPAPVKPVVVKAEAPAPAPVKAEVKAEAPVKVAPKRQEPPAKAPAKAPVHTEAEMRSALRGCATADLRTEAVGSGIEGAASMNKGALIDALVGLVLAEQQMVASPTPVTPAANAKGKGKPDLRVVRGAEVEF
jgi:hypothetical protein